MRTKKKYLELLQARVLRFKSAKDIVGNKNLFEAFKEHYNSEYKAQLHFIEQRYPEVSEQFKITCAIDTLLSRKKIYKRVSIYKNLPKKEKKDNQNPFLHKIPQAKPMHDSKVRVPRKSAKNRCKNFRRMVSMGIVSNKFLNVV